ncbi:hypothetical protein M0R45_013361 [Rubus argutus]|uniref:Uncharacterized protein n=1 Tax=Rubus argutus TaxID=59490 RepID=A0AAW1XKY6_RUBAR
MTFLSLLELTKSKGFGICSSSSFSPMKLELELELKIRKTVTKVGANQTHSLLLHFRDSDRDPLTAASAAEELIKEIKHLL